MFMMELRSRYFNYVEESKANLEGILAEAAGFDQDVQVTGDELTKPSRNCNNHVTMLY